jgi:hypothetical protein
MNIMLTGGRQRGFLYPEIPVFRSEVEVTQVMATIRGRRSSPVLESQSFRSESRLCAMFVADDDFNLTLLASKLHVRREKAKEVLAAWGINWEDRSYAAGEEEAHSGRLAA